MNIFIFFASEMKPNPACATCVPNDRIPGMPQTAHTKCKHEQQLCYHFVFVLFFFSSSSFQGQFSRNQNFIIMIIRIFMLITITSRVVFHNFRLYSFPCLGFTWYLELHPILAVCRSVFFSCFALFFSRFSFVFFVKKIVVSFTLLLHSSRMARYYSQLNAGSHDLVFVHAYSLPFP